MENILELNNVIKDYPGVRALDNVSFNIKKGEIHAICGENGAGKSTLIKAISGAIKLSSGNIKFKNEDITDTNPKEIIDKGISVIYQELNLFPNMTIYENIYFGIEPKKNGFLDRKKMIKDSEDVLKRLGINIDVTRKVKDITVAYQQMVEICKSIVKKSEIIIMDEPTSALTEKEVEILLDVTKKLNAEGITIIYISHKLEEVIYISDRITIFRDGKYIETLNSKDTNVDRIVKMMVGRDIEDIYPEKREKIGETVLECRKLSGGIVKDASFSLRKGEILGFGGLVGSGRTELVKLIFGANKLSSGDIYINGKKIKINKTDDAIKLGIGFVPENRASEGLIINKSILFNEILPNLDIYQKTIFNIIDNRLAKSDTNSVNKNLKVKMTDPMQVVGSLSGGNQQKIVLSKWLLKKCDILILDEPTRGIDVGAKQEIYKLIDTLAKAGKSIIIVSSEMPELIGLSDRVLIMSEGSITGELEGEDMTQENIMRLASAK